MTPPHPATELALALQGGGAHGAFTWGVLDALLANGLSIRAVSGTSAGAINAVALAQGLLEGGQDGATRRLASVWQAVAESVPPLMVESGEDDTPGLSPMARALMQWTHFLPPSVLNPLALDPLRDVLTEQIDFAALRRSSPLQLFIAATHANSGRLHLFRETELTLEHVLASACLPTMHAPVMIQGEPYWDGGYSANPALYPLVFDSPVRDVLIVLLTPLVHRSTPETAEQIRTRVTEIAFNANFLREVRALAEARAYASGGWWKLGRIERRLAAVRWHLIAGGEALIHLPSETKLLAHGPFLQRLHETGQRFTRDWLARHGKALGRDSSEDLLQRFG